ncbi:MAG: cobalamin B12-binding domain-containing protein [bacterium JZ-2024 1]
MATPHRIVVSKVGLDGHDRGVKVVARALRDAGFEVIYTGLHRTPEEVVDIAIQEDAEMLAVSLLSGAHMTLVPKILRLLKEKQAEDIYVVIGGTIPDDDARKLKELGVKAVYPPGSLTTMIVKEIHALLEKRGKVVSS